MEMTLNLESDLSRLGDLTLDNILKTLKERYKRDLIYTSVKDILIAINPYKPLKIYDDKTHDEYHWDKFVPNQPPHIFQVAADAYKRLRDTETDQVIIVSGESGAGKTESTKLMVRHLVNMCQTKDDDMNLHEKIIRINPLLEAYGNAKTILNENSSRFAKYLEISFKEDGQLAGAVVRDYMLEKSRVVHQSDNEGIFHIFYALFAGCPMSMREDLFLEGDVDQYRIMRSDPYSLANNDHYQAMYRESMDVLQMIKVDREVLHLMLAAVIHITEIEFEENNKGVAQIKDAAPFVHAVMLLNLNEETFGEALIASSRTIKETTVATYKTVKEAEDGRDALAKILYERMFGWLVRQINQNLHPNRLGTNISASIGILDIAGFEKLRNNSFEQMLINIVNEKLQSFMNERIFKMEMEIYHDEGIQLEGINFVNNDDILELFEKKTVGILAILDEQSTFRQGSDDSFAKQMKAKHSSHPKFEKTKQDIMFGINHFAAMVPYSTEGFIEKNRDRLNPELMAVMKASENDFISDLFVVKRGPTGTISAEHAAYRKSTRGVKVMTNIKGNVQLKPTKEGQMLAQQLGKSLKKKFGDVKMPQKDGSTKVATQEPDKTLVSFFRRSLLELIQKLGSGEPFFVRCIKANTSHRPDKFDEALVQDQLKYNGLAEVAKIRKMGFAVRRPCEEFVNRYKTAHAFIKWPTDAKAAIQKIMLRAPQIYHRDFRIGKTMVFMTHELEQHMERCLALRRNTAAKMVTRCIRKIAAQKKQEREKREREEREKREKREQEEAMKRQAKESQQHGGEDYVDAPGGVERTSARPNGGPGYNIGVSVNRTEPGPSNGTTNESSDTDSSSFSNPYDKVQPPTPPRSHSPTELGGEQESSPEKTSKKERLAFWDLPQIIARERKIRDVHEDRGLQVIKVVTYIIIFLSLLWCAVVQKVSLMTLVAYQYPLYENQTETQVQERAVISAGKHIVLAIAILIPYCFIFLSSALKWMFGSFLFPGVSTLVISCITEMFHSIGICIMCFVILPHLDIVRGILLLNGVAVIPSILFPVCGSDVKISRSQHIKRRGPFKKFMLFSCNILVAIIQLGFIPLILVTDNFTDTSDIDKDETLIALFIVGMIFVSFSWWENFIDDKFCGNTSKGSFMKKTVLAIKFDLQESRPVVTFFTSLLKIAITVAGAWVTKIFKPFSDSANAEFHSIDEVTVSEAFGKLWEMPIKDNSAIIALTLAAFVGYYVGYTACKLKLQRFSFNIPLLLSTPVATALVAYDCDTDIFFPFTNEIQTMCKEQNDTLDRAFVYIIGIIVWISIYWLCRHIFRPNIERLAKTERLFINPYYCSVFFEQHMLLNRRRHNRKVHKVIKDDEEQYRLSEFDSKINVEGEEVDDTESINHIVEDGKAIDDTDVYGDKYRNRKFRDVPTIYACATMWHENKQEMVQLMKSVFRMDRDQSLRRTAEVISMKQDKDFYEFEAHIFFDDAMELDDNDEMVPNQFVRLLMSILNEAVSSVYEKSMALKVPYIVPSPYGGQVIISMPGDNFLFVHLKDKQKIRHKKRWSQVMYMYYLLGFRIVRMCQETVDAALAEGKINELLGWMEGANVAVGSVGKSHIFQAFDEQVLRKASNTYLLALDGDVDFSPGAVRLLVDRMRKSEKVGAACGRIHPIGTGPVVWFQKFEYAIAHWLQKATEHVLGCVLCSPGCFSLFRGSALMDDNVMKKYTILPTSPVHHLMYDQGEDRWLCTLLLQQGYRVDYAAGSDAFTYAPEGFGEFFNQRRRWMPSTVFNIIDLLADYQNTVAINSNISMLYIFYQASLLLSTVIGPATIIMMIAGANLVVFKTNLIWSYAIAMVPAIFYFIICFFTKTKVQIQLAEILTGMYAFVMMIVLVGTIVTAAKESIFHPSVIFIVFLIFAFSFSAMLHPKEWTCIIFGSLYFIIIPTGFLLLIIYSLANMHVVSWGTREVPKKKSKEDIEKEKKAEEEKKKKKQEQGFFGRFLPQFPTKDLKELLSKLTDSNTAKKDSLPDDSETVQLLKEMNESMRILAGKNTGDGKPKASFDLTDGKTDQRDTDIKPDRDTKTDKPKGILRKTTSDPEAKPKLSVSIKDDDEGQTKKKRDELVNPAWAEIDELKHGKKIAMMPEELTFWQDFLNKYLKPLDLDDATKKETAKGLLELRTNICTGMAVTNLLWIAINFMFQLTSPTDIKLGSDSSSETGLNLEEEEGISDSSDSTYDPISGLSVDVLGLMFVFFYLLIILIQFAGMIIHRWGTFLHLVSVTRLRNPFHVRSLRKGKEQTKEVTEIQPADAFKICEALLKEPLPDYNSDSDDDEEEEERIRNQLTTIGKTGTKLGITYKDNVFGASTRLLDRTTRLRQTDWTGLAKSAKVIQEGLKATLAKTISAPDSREQNERVQHLYRMEKDKYIDRPLPPVRRRYNFGPGRADMGSKWKSLIERQQPRHEDLIPDETGEDRIYDAIKSQGTVGRQLGKKLKLYAKTADNRDNRAVHFDITDSGRPNDRRPVSVSSHYYYTGGGHHAHYDTKEMW